MILKNFFRGRKSRKNRLVKFWRHRPDPNLGLRIEICRIVGGRINERSVVGFTYAFCEIQLCWIFQKKILRPWVLLNFKLFKTSKFEVQTLPYNDFYIF
jgi:hypothetical protein